MRKTATLSDYKLEGMASILESTLNGIIRLSEFVMTELNKLSAKIDLIEEKEPEVKNLSSFLPPPEYSSNSTLTPASKDKAIKLTSQARRDYVRKAVLDELKELLEKKGKQS